MIDTPADALWALVRDFNGLPRWYPGISDSHIEEELPADQIGCVRRFRAQDGGLFREQLLTLSDYDYTCVYAMLQGPMDLSNYVATMKITPITDGTRSFVEWSAEFDCAPDREAALRQTVGQGVFQTGFDALKAVKAGP